MLLVTLGASLLGNLLTIKGTIRASEGTFRAEFRLTKIDDMRNYFLEEIKQNELMSKKHKIVCAALNYIEHFLILASRINGCNSFSGCATLIGILIGIIRSAI